MYLYIYIYITPEYNQQYCIIYTPEHIYIYYTEQCLTCSDHTTKDWVSGGVEECTWIVLFGSIPLPGPMFKNSNNCLLTVTGCYR